MLVFHGPEAVLVLRFHGDGRLKWFTHAFASITAAANYGIGCVMRHNIPHRTYAQYPLLFGGNLFTDA